MPFFCRLRESWLSISPIRLHAHAAGERPVDIEGFLGNTPPRRRRHEFQRAHVVQPVGELDQQHANVIGDRQQQLAQVFGLLGLARHQLQPLQLGESLNQCTDLVAEDLVDFRAGGFGILDGVVQQCCDNGGIIELEVGEDRGHFQRMREIGIAGGAGLGAVRLHGVDVGAVQQIFVGVGVIGTDPFDEVVLSHHARARRLGRPILLSVLRLIGRLTAIGRHGDRIGRGLHLPVVAAPTRHFSVRLRAGLSQARLTIQSSAFSERSSTSFPREMPDFRHQAQCNVKPAARRSHQRQPRGIRPRWVSAPW
jgi:hypothetical protein